MSKTPTVTADLQTVLRKAGLRATAARVAVMRSLMVAHTPLSHADVCDKLQRLGMDRATVYRNLVDLAEAGLVRRNDLGDHIWRFEWISEAEQAHRADAHPHFVCSDCGTVECLPTESVSLKPIRGVPRTVGQHAVEVHVRGLCDACV